MKLLVLSDLHNEFSVFKPVKTPADIVVLAGDIDNGAYGIRWARKIFPKKEVIYVPGNHEFYRRDRLDTLALLRSTAQKYCVHLLDNDEVIIKGFRFLGSTLWTDFKLFGESRKEEAIKDGLKRLNDFKIIHEGEMGLFTPERSIELHEQSLAWLVSRVDEPFDGKTVVVTHHLPSMLSVSEEYKTSLLSACFASNLDSIFGKMSLWIHGHTHGNYDYVANGTRVICNPRGYVTLAHGFENVNFKPGLVVEI